VISKDNVPYFPAVTFVFGRRAIHGKNLVENEKGVDFNWYLRETISALKILNYQQNGNTSDI
jgi:hypothetical protein